MKGLIYFVLILVFSFCTVLLIKLVIMKFSHKKEGENPTPKVYFVTKTRKKRQRDNGVSVPITVSGAVIEKERKR